MKQLNLYVAKGFLGSNKTNPLRDIANVSRKTPFFFWLVLMTSSLLGK